MRKIALFIFENMTDYEVTFVSHLLNTQEDIQVVTVAYEDISIKGQTGFIYSPEMILKDIEYDEFDGLIIPGGWNGDYREELQDLILYFKYNNKLVAGICGAGTVYLAKASALDNAQYTTPVKKWTNRHKSIFGEEDPFNRENFVNVDIVRDCNIITANGNAFIDFGIEICDFLNLFEGKEEKKAFRNMFN